MKELTEIGIPVVEHCNLNCRGCLHFCHRGQKPFYADVNQFECDMRRLKSFFDNIQIIRLYGGEPFLHKELDKFIWCSREVFSEAEIEILTNGIMLMDIPQELIRAIRKNDVKICWSVYPIIREEAYLKTLALLKSWGLRFSAGRVNEFYACFDAKGGIDWDYAFKRCSGKRCHVLKCGKISNCPAPAVERYMNELGAGIDFSDGLLDLYRKDMTAEKIVEFLNKPHSACGYCTAPHYFKWEAQGKEVSLADWRYDR